LCGAISADPEQHGWVREPSRLQLFDRTVAES
jgi:hypothetical protein